MPSAALDALAGLTRPPHDFGPFLDGSFKKGSDPRPQDWQGPANVPDPKPGDGDGLGGSEDTPQAVGYHPGSRHAVTGNVLAHSILQAGRWAGEAMSKVPMAETQGGSGLSSGGRGVQCPVPGALCYLLPPGSEATSGQLCRVDLTLRPIQTARAPHPLIGPVRSAARPGSSPLL